MSNISYWLWYVVMRILHFLFYSTVSFWYHEKGKVVPPIENPVLLKSAKKLAEEIRESKITSEEVIRAYIARIKEVQPIINAVVEDCFEEALHEARQVDALIRSATLTTQQIQENKPLLGVPFTVKALIHVKGYHSTGTACSKILEDVVTKDDESVALLKKAGGIVLAITNSPEFGASPETVNLLYGRTCNPYDTNKTPGGSSGGEAAIISAGGSVIGLGTDISGSLRIPSHYTGIFAHKPSRGLIPSNLHFGLGNKEMDKLYCTGPMCRFSEDMPLLTKILAEKHEERCKLYREINFKRLKIYYTTTFDDPFAYPVDKEIVEGIVQAASYFVKQHGAIAEEIKIPVIKYSFLIGYYYFCSKSVQNFMEFVTSGKVNRLNAIWESIKFYFGKSNFHFYTIVMSIFTKNPLLFQEAQVPYYSKLFEQLIEEFDNILDENSVFLYPTWPMTAPCHRTGAISIPNAGYVGIFNLTGAPVTVCPIGFNKRTLLPQSIQIIGKKYNDALTMACASELEKLFSGWIPPGNY